MKLQKGNLLIAEPSILNDNSFKRSIVLLTEHTSENSVGFILNRPLEYTLEDLIPDLDCNFTVYQGGPVEQDNLYFVHKIPELLSGSIEVANGIFWGGNFDALKKLLINKQVTTDDIRFFLGYSGWGKYQLQEEMNQKSWFVTGNDFDNILSIDEENLWKNKLIQKGGNYKLWANAPSDFNLN
ncbi:YqgE/AlgH family protein [Polaribacter sp.]|nr:YqgE/AlgH family protein [Polaribacter sp.]